jgi:hypothetical protein
MRLRSPGNSIFPAQKERGGAYAGAGCEAGQCYSLVKCLKGLKTA